jgi:hypothetical protein
LGVAKGFSRSTLGGTLGGTKAKSVEYYAMLSVLNEALKGFRLDGYSEEHMGFSAGGGMQRLLRGTRVH